jgi:hypothetical protein
LYDVFFTELVAGIEESEFLTLEVAGFVSLAKAASKYDGIIN